MINYNSIPKGKVFGFPIVASQLKKLADILAKEALVTKRPFLIAFSDVHVITRACTYPLYGNQLRIFDLICPDGMPLVWLLHEGKTRAEKNAKRITGPDMMEELLTPSAQTAGLKHFFLGSTPEMLETLKAKMLEKHPNLDIVGMYSPPFGEWSQEENWAIGDKIKDSGANVVWVGLGCPKQERWLAMNAHILPPALYLAVGAAFAFHSGAVKRAPLWMQKASLEWLYRLCKEPRRLFKRYFIHNLLFLYYLFTAKGRLS